MKNDILKIIEAVLKTATFVVWDYDTDKPDFIKCYHCGEKIHNKPYVTLEHSPECVVLSAERVKEKLSRRNEKKRFKKDQNIKNRIVDQWIEKQKNKQWSE